MFSYIEAKRISDCSHARCAIFVYIQSAFIARALFGQHVLHSNQLYIKVSGWRCLRINSIRVVARPEKDAAYHRILLHFHRCGFIDMYRKYKFGNLKFSMFLS